MYFIRNYCIYICISFCYLQKAVKNSLRFEEVISKSKKLAQSTHQSLTDWQENKLACTEEGIVANK